METNLVYLSLGSNIGEKERNLKKAVKFIREIPGVSVVAKSSLYQTDPVGYTDQDWFLNAVISVTTKLTARKLLEKTQEIENLMGRKRIIHWGPRIIDIDILLYNTEIISEPGLIVPHPEIHKRRFILVPLTEIDRTIFIPSLGIVSEIFVNCKFTDNVTLVKQRDQW